MTEKTMTPSPRRPVVHPLPEDGDGGPATEAEIRAMERAKVSPDLIRLARAQNRHRRTFWRYLRGSA